MGLPDYDINGSHPRPVAMRVRYNQDTVLDQAMSRLLRGPELSAECGIIGNLPCMAVSRR